MYTYIYIYVYINQYDWIDDQLPYILLILTIGYSMAMTPQERPHGGGCGGCQLQARQGAAGNSRVRITIR